MTALVHVAVGVVVGNDGKILIAKRPQAAHQGGLWEFPGGKVDAGENIHQALNRELKEELAIDVIASEPLIQIRHHYPDKSVLLDVYKVTCFDGQPRGAEGQPICWVHPKALTDFEFPAANRPIIQAIALSDKYLITGDFEDEADFVRRLRYALEKGVRLVQLRLRDFNLIAQESLLVKAIALVGEYSATLLINSSVKKFDEILSRFPAANIGLHLNRHEIKAVSKRPISSSYLLGVSCHNREEMVLAEKLNPNYLFLSPVKQTPSHPATPPMGWDSFASLVTSTNTPVFALGGVSEADLSQAKLAGAQGIAGISAWWQAVE